MRAYAVSFPPEGEEEPIVVISEKISNYALVLPFRTKVHLVLGPGLGSTSILLERALLWSPSLSPPPVNHNSIKSLRDVLVCLVSWVPVS